MRVRTRSHPALEATASKEPAHTFTLHTLVIAVVTCSFARWAFGPIFLTDCALVYSRASVRARHAPALPFGEAYVMAGRSTACTNCDWSRALHAVGYCNSTTSTASIALFDSF